ncbi:MAG: glycine cleavage system protein H [Gammaproteobacteria bacterium]|jgi:glycine cleavage system H protein|uniref:Lipoyl-binding domain-containing protein n=1 Tax=marine metagenome TaxID=408172 RepID=A0A381RNC6_9ZZZZ|nr:glycine cleavage system protein H [Gammaproteobacteria bacterium]MBN85680.1 glycine cleavage system protein H [Gammaproteobacteria bacterium]MCS5568995.1 glycine cleavage system protein GcvH [Pseudomonadales bacterium]MEC9240117.1 glycine cleavage system protein GcvH [Pseudomonadota bacterium]MEE3133151.1 glycine cleavage system protein GcvH [Pseudomonadota bacterium]|tara:strand:+ start:24736 stop:25128 length:393 start_codon:yes stop_codon:yes gene_type:complete
MSETPEDIYYAESHEWARLEEDGRITVGITDFAQDALGDIVYIELPQIGQSLQASVEAGIVESVKAASDIYAPVSGVVTAVNRSLEDAPENVNLDAYGDGWFFALEPSDVGELEDLLDYVAYREAAENER